MTTAWIAIGISTLALLGGSGILLTGIKIVRHLTRIETDVKQMKPVVMHVPNLYWRIANVEKHLDISAPEVPTFMNGSAED